MLLPSDGTRRLAKCSSAGAVGMRPARFLVLFLSLPVRRKRKKAPSRVSFFMADWKGLEPSTFRVTGGRSNQLNYQSKVRDTTSVHARLSPERGLVVTSSMAAK